MSLALRTIWETENYVTYPDVVRNRGVKICVARVEHQKSGSEEEALVFNHGFKGTRLAVVVVGDEVVAMGVPSVDDFEAASFFAVEFKV